MAMITYANFHQVLQIDIVALDLPSKSVKKTVMLDKAALTLHAMAGVTVILPANRCGNTVRLIGLHADGKVVVTIYLDKPAVESVIRVPRDVERLFVNKDNSIYCFLRHEGEMAKLDQNGNLRKTTGVACPPGSQVYFFEKLKNGCSILLRDHPHSKVKDDQAIHLLLTLVSRLSADKTLDQRSVIQSHFILPQLIETCPPALVYFKLKEQRRNLEKSVAIETHLLRVLLVNRNKFHSVSVAEEIQAPCIASYRITADRSAEIIVDLQVFGDHQVASSYVKYLIKF